MIASDPQLYNTNERTTKEHFKLKTVKNKVEDGELGIFGAEKYFKGVIDEELVRKSFNTGVHYCPNLPQEKLDEPCPVLKPKTTSSVRSESSWNSRRGLLVGNCSDNHSKKTGVKSLFASLRCNCSDKGSVKVTEVEQAVKGGDLSQKTKSLSSKRADEDVNNKRKDCFTFPVLNHSVVDVKHPQLPEFKCKREVKKSINLERKVTMLSWDGLTPRAEILDSSRNGPQNDTASDGSSDLFEIESFSTNEDSLFLAGQAIENNMYAPSEASVDWSVVTASVADFSVTEDLAVARNAKGSGIVSGCKSFKAVRISGDECGMTSSGEKAAIIVPPARREWCNRLDPATSVAKIQADTKLICVGSGLHTSQNGFVAARPVHRAHSTNASSDKSHMKQK